jgi:predicted Zn-dependent peptidase
LFEELREKRGLCYDIASSFKRHVDIGEFNIHAGVDNKKSILSINAIIDELNKLKRELVTEGELERAKEYAKGQFELGLENTSPRMIWLGDRVMSDGHIPDIKEVERNIDKVSIKDIKRISAKIFKGNNINLALIARVTDKERSQIKRSLARLSEDKLLTKKKR